VKIQFFGHAAFGLTSASGLRVLLDPYEPGAFGGLLDYKAIPGQWDVAIVSHDHLDHNHVSPSFGTPAVVKSDGTYRGLGVRTLTVKHGDAGGRVDFQSRVSVFALDGMTLLHPGDAGHPLSDAMRATLPAVDVLFVPVGGHFTMGPADAVTFIRQVAPRVAIPMHYLTPQVKLAIRPLADFLAAWGGSVRRFGRGEAEVDALSLPAATELWVMPALMV
jgi:L-ascorbate metabolism protein UlaG (beta-lactamase superfamily)